uniref:Fas apoptotic inhibitory molecule 2a n=1 Tax=Eptatretus burgeri TaxID=7764 RepID=A0A8C4PXC1_EPTBU
MSGYPPPYPSQPGGYPPQPGGYPPQPGGYPPQPGGYPSHPGSYPGQPAGYYGQPEYPGGYPPQPGPYPGPPPQGYPGQPGYPPAPQGGGQPGFGFPPPSMPLHPAFGRMGPGNPIQEYNGSENVGQWDDSNVRRVFIRKVYTILSAQLFVTFGIVAIFSFVMPVKIWVKRHPAAYWASYAVFLGTYLALACCTKARRKFPLNFILLSVFTLAMSYLTGMLASFYETYSVLICLGITALVCCAVTLFCFQTKVDFTSCHGLMFVLLIALFLTGLVAAFTVPFGYIPWIQTVYAGLGAVVFTLFLAFDTQLLLGNRKHSISPEEHIHGALSLYMDIVYIFTFLLQLVGTRE